MRGRNKGSSSRGRRSLLPAAVAVVGCTGAALVSSALATTFTVQIAKSSVTNQAGSTRSEKIVVNSGSFALYELTGDSKTHQECTKANGCFTFWPPATVPSAQHLSAGPGVPGKLGTWRRDGFVQLTLSGHPLYRYAPDIRAQSAMGQGAKSFGGTWHVIAGAASTSAGGW